MLRKDKGLESQRREIVTAIERERHIQRQREKDRCGNRLRKIDKATEKEGEIQRKERARQRQRQREKAINSDRERKT